jgi:hypothetical protein
VGNPQVISVTMVTMATMGIPSLTENSDVTGAIRKDQISANAPELLRYMYILPNLFLKRVRRMFSLLPQSCYFGSCDCHSDD